MTVILATQNAGESCELGASLDYTAKIHLKKEKNAYSHPFMPGSHTSNSCSQFSFIAILLIL